MLPTLHLEHTVRLPAFEYVPKLHIAQADAPLIELVMLPGGHVTHGLVPTEPWNLPLGQSVHWVAAISPLRTEPGKHC